MQPPARFVEEEDDSAAAVSQPASAAASAPAKGNPRSAAAIAARLSTQPVTGKKRGAPAPAAPAGAGGDGGGGRLKKQRQSGAGKGGAVGFRDLGDDDDMDIGLQDWQDDNSEDMKDFIVQVTLLELTFLFC